MIAISILAYLMIIVIPGFLKIKIIPINNNKVNNLVNNFVFNVNKSYSITYGDVITSKITSSLPFDYSWYDYLKQVYGHNINLSTYEQINKSSILFVYKFAKVKVIELYKSDSSLVKTHLSDSADKYRISYMHNSLFTDNAWIEVSRFSTSYLNLGWNEGYSTGIYNTYIKNENYTVGNNTKVPYGCYFHSAPGSGIYINTKKIYMESNDISLSKQFPHTLVNDTNFCINSDKSIQCGDKYICTLVLNEGYYSKYNNIGIKLSRKNRTKLRNDQFVICGGNCATQELSTTCPLLELRMGYQANQLCQCSNKSPILNCGKYLNVGEMFGVIPSNYSFGATSTKASYYNDTHSQSRSSSRSSNSSSSSSIDSNDNYHDPTRFQPFTCISRKPSRYHDINESSSNSNSKSNVNAQIMFINDHLFNSNFHNYSSMYLRNNNTNNSNNYQTNINNNNNTSSQTLNEQFYVITFDSKFQTQTTPLIIPTATTTEMMINIKVYQFTKQRGKFNYFLTSPMNLYNISSTTSRFGNTEDNNKMDKIPYFDYQYIYKYDLVFLQSFLLKSNKNYDDSKNGNNNIHGADNGTSSLVGIISFNTAGQNYEDDNRIKIIHLIRDESMCLLTAEAKIIILIIICYNHEMKNYDTDDTHNEDDDVELAVFLHKCRNELLKNGYVHIILLINKDNNSHSISNTNSSDWYENIAGRKSLNYHNNQNMNENNNKVILQQQQKQRHATHNHHILDLSKGFHMLSFLYKEQNLKLSYHIDFYDV